MKLRRFWMRWPVVTAIIVVGGCGEVGTAKPPPVILRVVQAVQDEWGHCFDDAGTALRDADVDREDQAPHDFIVTLVSGESFRVPDDASIAEPDNAAAEDLAKECRP